MTLFFTIIIFLYAMTMAISALLNRLALNQKVNWRHFTIPLLFSITLLFLLI